MVTEFNNEGLSNWSAARQFRKHFLKEREEHIAIYNAYKEKVSKYIHSLTTEELKEYAKNLYSPEVLEKIFKRKPSYIINTLINFSGRKGLLIENEQERIAVKQYIRYIKSNNLTDNTPKMTKTLNGNPKLVEYRMNLEKEKLKELSPKVNIPYEELLVIWEKERYLKAELRIIYTFSSFYISLFRADFYGSIVFSDNSYLRFDYVDGGKVGTRFNGSYLEYPDYVSEDNIRLYYVKNKQIPYPYITGSENSKNKYKNLIHQYDPNVDELRTCKYNGWTLREILQEMNTTGFIQGNFKPKNPYKYVQNPEEFSKLVQTKEGMAEYIKLLNENTVIKQTKSIVPKVALFDEPIPAPVTKFNKFSKNNITYRSSFELLAFNFLDNTPDIVAWSSETIIVPYIKPQDQKLHRYYVDIWAIVRQPNNKFKTFLIEIKPANQVKKPRKTAKKSDKTYLTEMLTWTTNQAKWAAAKLYAKEHGMEFIIWTENELSLASPGMKYKHKKPTKKK